MSRKVDTSLSEQAEKNAVSALTSVKSGNGKVKGGGGVLSFRANGATMVSNPWSSAYQHSAPQSSAQETRRRWKVLGGVKQKPNPCANRCVQQGGSCVTVIRKKNSPSWQGKSKNVSGKNLSHPPGLVVFCFLSLYRGTSLIRNRHTLGPYSRPTPRALWWS